MSHRLPFISTLALVTLAMAALHGQAPSPPPPPPELARDLSGAGATGSASLAGTVVADDGTSRPLRGVTVALNGGPGGGRTATTDDSGHFAFTSLPSGRFMLSAQKRGWVNVQYGARQPGRGQGSFVAVADGEEKSDIVIRMPHGAAISGVITDANGLPVQNVGLTILQYRYVNGERTLGPIFGSSSGGNTDDRGAYRIYGLAPGDYVVSARPPNGMLQDVHPITDADIQWARQQIQRSQSGAAGSAVSGFGTSGSEAPAPAPVVGYSPIYYPGTPDSSAATQVSLRAGEDRSSIDFALQYVATAKLQGIVVDSAGRPRRDVMLSIVRSGQPPGVGNDVFLRPSGDGNFVGTGISPGQYTILARTNLPPPPPPPPPPVGPSVAPPPMTAPESVETLWASIDVDVEGHDISDLVLSLQPGMTTSGHVDFDADNAPAPAQVSSIRVSLTPAAAGVMPVSTVSTTLRPDGTFTLTGLTPGTYRLNAASTGPGRSGGPAAGWFIKAAAIGGHDVTDRPITIKPSDVLGDIVLTLSNKPAELSGKLIAGDGQSVSDYTIVVFTPDRTYWGLGSRRTVPARPQPDGSFRVGGLPAGDYYVAAIVHFDSSDLADPTFFEQLVSSSLKITLAEGEKRIQDFRLAGAR